MTDKGNWQNWLRIRILRLFHKHSLPRWIVFTTDSFVVLITFYFAYLLRFNLNPHAFNSIVAMHHALIAMSTYILFFLLYRTYAGLIRHTTIRDFFIIFVNNTSALALLLFLSILGRQLNWVKSTIVPISIILIHYGTMTVILFFERVLIKMIYEFITASPFEKKSVLIYGAGSMGVTVKQVIQNEKKTNFRIVAFLDDNKKLHGKKISGIPVYSPSKLSSAFISKLEAKVLLFAVNNLSAKRKSEVISKALDLGLELLDTPRFENWLHGEFQIKYLKKVKIKDLLGREPIKLDIEKIQGGLKGKTVLVTGAAGSIGSEIVRQLIKFDLDRLVLVDQAETPMFYLNSELELKYDMSRVRLMIADVTNQNKMIMIFDKYKPDIVFHAAAYKHVPLMETHPHEAFRVNVGGTKIITDLAMSYQVEKFVMISSDKAVNPTNVMGATKRICELYIQVMADSGKVKTQFITTRFGNVLGSNGSVIPLFTRQIEEGGPITITHPDITRYFMTIPEACQLVLEAGFMGKGGEIYVFDMGDPVKIVDLANQMIKLSGLVPGEDINIIFTGLRPGEKLYEELLSESESTQPTHHHKIMIARSGEIPSGEFVTRISKILKDVYDYSNDELCSYLKLLVPEYKQMHEGDS